MQRDAKFSVTKPASIVGRQRSRRRSIADGKNAAIQMRTQSIAKQLHGPTGGVGLTRLEDWSGSGNHPHADRRRLSSTHEMPQSIGECKASFSGLGELQGGRDGEDQSRIRLIVTLQ